MLMTTATEINLEGKNLYRAQWYCKETSGFPQSTCTDLIPVFQNCMRNKSVKVKQNSPSTSLWITTCDPFWFTRCLWCIHYWEQMLL